MIANLEPARDFCCCATTACGAAGKDLPVILCCHWHQYYLPTGFFRFFTKGAAKINHPRQEQKNLENKTPATTTTKK
jgi:hypothetical protein